MTTTTAPTVTKEEAAVTYLKEIVYDRETRDYALYLDKELVGFAHTFHEGEVTLDQLVYELLTSGITRTATELDGGDPEHVKVVEPAADMGGVWEGEKEEERDPALGDFCPFCLAGRMLTMYAQPGNRPYLQCSNPNCRFSLPLPPTPTEPPPNKEEAIRIGALALLQTGIDFCTVCGMAHRPTQCPQIGALLTAPTCTAHGCDRPATKASLIPGFHVCDECHQAGMLRILRDILYTGPRCPSCEDAVGQAGLCLACQEGGETVTQPALSLSL